MGTRRRDPPAGKMQGAVREGFQEEVTSELNPEGRLGVSQVKRKGREERAEETAGAEAQRQCRLWCI